MRVRVATAIAAASLCLITAVLFLPASSRAGDDPAAGWPPLRGFVRDIEYSLEVDGKQVPVELYMSTSAGAIIILAEPFRSPLALRAGVLATLDAVKVERRPDATLDVPAGAVVTPRGSFEVTPDGVSFTLDGHRANVRHVKAHALLGLRRLDEVTAHNPEYLASAATYAANETALGQLTQERRAVTVRVYYGSWCAHCRMLVPHAVKIEQRLAGSHIHFEYFGVGVPSGDPEAFKMGVKQIPTAIVYVEGKEIGRIVQDDAWNSLEVALRGVLAQHPSGIAGAG
jgi:thiol-disulfide isomerase/thioredoxin